MFASLRGDPYNALNLKGAYVWQDAARQEGKNPSQLCELKLGRSNGVGSRLLAPTAVELPCGRWR
jgi:hypothetical protein